MENEKVAGENQEEKNQDSEQDDKEEVNVEALTKENETLKAQKAHWKKKAEAKVEKPAKAEKEEKKSGDLNYGQLAYYNSLPDVIKITSETGRDYLTKAMDDTGKSQEVILEAKWFQAELKEVLEKETIKKATPSTTKRSTTSPKDKVEYWINKGELPPMGETELRRKVVREKRKRASNSGSFYNSPQ